MFCGWSREFGGLKREAKVLKGKEMEKLEK